MRPARWFRATSLIHQILYLGIIMLLILMLSYLVSNMFAKRIIEDKVKNTVNQILVQVKEKMDSFDSDMEGISNFLFYSPTVQSYLSTDDKLSRVLANRELTSVFSNAMSLKNNIRGIQLYDNKGKFLANLGTNRMQENPVSQTSTIEYSALVETDTSEPRDSRRSFYTISVPIYRLDNSGIATEYAGTGRFFMDASNFSPILKSAKVTASSQVMLLDQQHRSIVTEGQLKQETGFNMNEAQNNPDYIIQTIPLPRSGWSLVSIIPRDELLEDLGTIRQFNLIAYLMMAGITGLFLFIFFTRIWGPVRELMNFIKTYPRLGKDQRFEVKHHNEMGVLGMNLNKMLDEIDSLSLEVRDSQVRMYEIELAKKQMQVIAFRNQINPHFLYNTLESIRAVALYHEVSEIADISASLSNMFRYAVKGNNRVLIKDEIANVKEYAKIIDFRFMGRFQIHITADEHVMEERMLKLLLQPIVENAVFHGLERKMGQGQVHIDVQKTASGYIQFIVQDNGEGMEQDTYNRLMESLKQEESSSWSRESDKGIGLYNIYQRLKLFYGEDMQFSIESKPQVGTQVILAFSADIKEV